MISELNAICKVCADLALFGGEKKFVIMIRQLKIELTVGTLNDCNFSQAIREMS
jgi:hypothetical protein